MEITQVNNGFIVRVLEGDGFDLEKKGTVFQFKDSDFGVIEAAEEMLWFIIDYFGLSGSRYDEKRLVVRFEKGDKYEE